MDKVLLDLGFLKEEIESINEEYNDVIISEFKDKIILFKRYGCSNSFIRELILKHKHIFYYEIEKIEYSLIAIVSNGDMIEETILDIF